MGKWLANRNIYARGANGFRVMSHFRPQGSIPDSSTNWIKSVKAGIKQYNSHKSSEQDIQLSM
jgi:hypothetical protein